MKRPTRSGVAFSSEDSADTDHSMNSSVDAKENQGDNRKSPIH